MTDQYLFSVEFWHLTEWEVLDDFFILLEEQGFSPPVQIEENYKVHQLKGYHDPKLYKMLKKGKLMNKIYSEVFELIIFANKKKINEFYIKINEDKATQANLDAIVNFIKELLKEHPFYHFRAQLYGASIKYLRNFNSQTERTPVGPALFWQQYYYSTEYERQGGKAILENNNPYIEAEEIDGGIWIKVGNTPEEAHANDSELLLKATAALPPAFYDAPSAQEISEKYGEKKK